MSCENYINNMSCTLYENLLYTFGYITFGVPMTTIQGIYTNLQETFCFAIWLMYLIKVHVLKRYELILI